MAEDQRDDSDAQASLTENGQASGAGTTYIPTNADHAETIATSGVVTRALGSIDELDDAPGNIDEIDNSEAIIGTIHTPKMITPPAVIRSLGGAVPGEANPARGHDEDFDSSGPTDTAALLMERELGEENMSASDSLREPGNVADSSAYQEQGYPLAEDADGIGGEHVSTDHVELEHMRQEADTFLAGENRFDETLARIDSKEDQNTRDIERSVSRSGLPYSSSVYEREEMVNPTTPSDLEVTTDMRALPPQTDRSRPLTVVSVFGTVAEAQDAVRGLRQIGIAPDDISVLAREGTDSGPAQTTGVEAAGEESNRVSSPELPNDEDLPTTVADQAGTDLTPDAGGTDAPSTGDRGGLARDEGSITDIQSPADPDIYSDFADSDADYRTEEGEGAAQTGQQSPDAKMTPVTDEGFNDDVPVAQLDAGRGAVIGGAFGGFTGLLLGLGALAIPGIGPIVAAGPLAGAIAGLITGTATGGIIGALLHAGVPKEHAETYARHLNGGGVLVSVRTDIINRAAVLDVLRAHGASEAH